jgi:hypothetical protein
MVRGGESARLHAEYTQHGGKRLGFTEIGLPHLEIGKAELRGKARISKLTPLNLQSIPEAKAGNPSSAPSRARASRRDRAGRAERGSHRECANPNAIAKSTNADKAMSNAAEPLEPVLKQHFPWCWLVF